MYRDRYKKDPKPKNPNEGISQKGDKGKLPKDNPQRQAKGDKLPVTKKDPKARNPNQGLSQAKPKAAAPKPKARPAAPAKDSGGSPAPKPKLKPTSGPASGKMAYEAPKAAGKLTSYQRTMKLVASRDVAQPKRRK